MIRNIQTAQTRATLRYWFAMVSVHLPRDPAAGLDEYTSTAAHHRTAHKIDADLKYSDNDAA